MNLHKPVTLADQIFERLENDIFAGVYERGSVLTELRLCEELGVSRTPVREALNRLEQEHLIESHSSKGLVVIGITRQDAMVIYEVRKRIEGLAAAMCAEKAGDDQIAQLRDIVDLQEFCAGKKDSEKVRMLDNQFHDLVYRACGSVVLYDTLMPLHKKIQKFRKASVEVRSRAAESAQEHRRIFEAIAARDPKAAEEAMLAHIASAQNFVCELKEE